MNKVVMIGRLVKDTELRFTQNGKAVCNFTLAVSRKFQKNKADFFNCVAWGRTAETLTELCGKGNRVAIDGEINIESWQDRVGNSGKKVVVNVNSFDAIDFKGRDYREHWQQKNNGSQAEYTSQVNGYPADEDEIPF